MVYWHLQTAEKLMNEEFNYINIEHFAYQCPP